MATVDVSGQVTIDRLHAPDAIRFSGLMDDVSMRRETSRSGEMASAWDPSRATVECGCAWCANRRVGPVSRRMSGIAADWAVFVDDSLQTGERAVAR